MFDFDRNGRPLSPVKRPGAVVILDRVRDALLAHLRFGGSRTDDLCREVEEIAPFVSPVPVESLIQDLASITRGLLTSTISTSLRCDAVASVHKQAERLITLQASLRGPGPQELRDDLARTAVEIAAGATS